MSSRKGVTVDEVLPGGAAHEAGVVEGDCLLSVSGHPVYDIIDYMFHSTGPDQRFVFSKKGIKTHVEVILQEGQDPGLILKHFKTRTCRNKCLFCFVSQLPRGLRKSLYVKDEDYRMSFLYGSYVTLTNLSAQDKKRIVKQRLSPIYISVHSTDIDIRRQLLGNPKAPDIMKELQYFKDNRISMHSQVVLCPGYNDGADLKKTLVNLSSLYPYMKSIAVVPVGLTSHRKDKLGPVEKKDAADALRAIESLQKRFKKKYGDPIVYASDELYIKAAHPFPRLREYRELPQLENGVGMVPLFLSQARSAAPVRTSSLKALTFTGVSFYPYLKRFTDKLGRHGISVTPVPVDNAMFGRTVTVAGLLSGRDVIRALSSVEGDFDLLLVPDTVLREGHDVFLDDVSVTDIENAIGIKTKTIEPTPAGLIQGVLEEK